LEKVLIENMSPGLKSKHLIVPTQYYDPETFQVNHLVGLFLAKGWYVTVIAPAPSYPSASVLGDCTLATFRHHRLRICRFPTLKRNGTVFFAIINSLLFAILGSFLTILYALRYPTAQVFAVQYSPFTCIVPAWFAAFFLNKKASLWIFDLWPQSISTLLGRSFAVSFVSAVTEACVSVVYSSFDNYFVSSPSFLVAPLVQGLKNVELLYSWEPSHILPRLSSDTSVLPLPIRIISIGNLGAAHDLDLLEELLLYTTSLTFSCSFVGGGSGMSRLQTFCTSHELNHVTFHGFLPKADCLRLCSLADLSIVPFRDSEISGTICYRFVSSLSVATPVISFGSNAVSELVSSCSCGFILDRSDSSVASPPRDGHVFESLSMLVDVIQSRLAFIRSSCRDSAFALFESRFSQTAAEASLQRFFVDY
jgi:glycosyltransferase involved in cell wall biosynthesis